MPISFPAALPPPVLPPPAPIPSNTRSIGSISLNDLTTTFISQVMIPTTRAIQVERHINRQGRISQVNEDWEPLVIEIRGAWRDDLAGGRFFEDFKAGLLGQRQAQFVLGDGTMFAMVDVLDIAYTVIAESGQGTLLKDRAYAWTSKVQSYEPFARELAPKLAVFGPLTTGNGTFTTQFSASYGGTAFAEPTWQFTLVIPGGVTVTRLRLQNTSTTLADANTASISLGAGTWNVLMDASGGNAGNFGLFPTTPNNNPYGLLAGYSLGYGVTLLPLGGGQQDLDFIGTIPTLVPSPAPSIPPVPYTNSIVASVSATGTLTSATLSAVAPARYIR